MDRYLLLALIIFLSACASRPCCTNYIKVMPVKYVERSGQPNSRFGWLPTNVKSAKVFNVIIGNKQYFELLDSVGEKTIIDELAKYAENEVTKLGHCKEKIAQTKNKGIFGPHTGEYVSLLVECI